MKTTIRCLLWSCSIFTLLGIGSPALAQKAVPLSEQEKTTIKEGTPTTVKKLPAATGVKKKSSSALTPAVTSKQPTTTKKTSTLPVTPSYKPPTAATTKQSTTIKKTSTLPVAPSYKPPAASVPSISGKSAVQSGTATVAPRSGSAPLFPVSAGTGTSGQGQGIQTPSGSYVTPMYTPPAPKVKSTYAPVGTDQKGAMPEPIPYPGAKSTYVPVGTDQKGAMPEPIPTPSTPWGSGKPVGQSGTATVAPRSGSVPLFPASGGAGAGGQEQGVKTPSSFVVPTSVDGKGVAPGSEAAPALSGSAPPPVIDSSERLRLLREKYGKGSGGGEASSGQAESTDTGTAVEPGSSPTSKGTPPRSQAEIKSKTIPASPSTSIAPQRADDTSRIAGDGRIIQENPLVRELSGKDLMAMGNKLEEFINSYGGLKGGLLGGAGIAPPGSTGQSRIPGFDDLTGGQSGRSPQSVKDSLGTGLTSGQTGNIPSAPGGLNVPSGTGPVGDTGWQSPMESFGGSSGSNRESGRGLSSDMNKRGYVSSETATVNVGIGTVTYHKDDNGNVTVSYVPSGNTSNQNQSWATNETNSDGSETTRAHYTDESGRKVTDTYHINERGKVDGWRRVTTDPKTGKKTTATFDKDGNPLPDLVDPSGNTKRVDPENPPPPSWVIEAASKLLADIRSGNFHPTADENVIDRDPDAEGGKRYQGSTSLVKPPRPDQPVPGETNTGLTGNEPTPDEVRDPYGTRFGQDIDPTPPTSNDQGAK